jgi:hypothetical protein
MALNNILLFAFSSHGAGVILWGSHPFHWFVLALFAILPVMGLLNLIDPVFSHGHMAGRHCTGGVILTRRLYLKLPPDLRKQCMLRGRFYMIDIGRWWMHDLGVPQPQQERLLVEIARDFRRYQPARDDLRLFVARMPGMRCRTQPQHYYSWTDLFGHPL